MFAAEIRKRRVAHMRGYPQWRWHLDEVFVKINGKLCYLWRADDHEGEVLEAVVTARRDKAAALKLLKRIMKKYGLGCVDSWDSLLGANQIQGCFWEAVLGVMARLVLSEAAWERMAPLIIGRPDQKGSTGRDNRMFVEGVLWIVRTGSPWRDLPERLAIGTACSSASADGASRGSGGGSSRRCRMIRTLNI